MTTKQIGEEDCQVEKFNNILKKVLPDDYESQIKANLLYELTINNDLEYEIKQDKLGKPKRGQSAFQTDVCVFLKKKKDDTMILIPKVVFEFKMRITTHDVITYSNKAKRHKQLYPYLRYGMLYFGNNRIPKRFFKHNDGMDFCFVIADEIDEDVVKTIIMKEIEASNILEEIFFGKKYKSCNHFRLNVEIN